MVAALPKTKKRADSVVLNNIGWAQFQIILDNLGEHRAARVAYDDGALEIMVPLPEHEHLKEIIGDAVKDIADELEIDYESYGSTTWRKQLESAGLEPDNCFYFQNEPTVRGRRDIDLTKGDPPPDLTLEIDITSKSLNRFPIYARLGVPEIWCYDNGALEIYHLCSKEYIEAEASLAIPSLPIQEIPQLIEEKRYEGRRAIKKAVKEWVQEKTGSKS